MPDRWQPLLQWRTLEVGSRAGQVWPMILMACADQPRFRQEVLSEFVRSYLEHGPLPAGAPGRVRQQLVSG